MQAEQSYQYKILNEIWSDIKNSTIPAFLEWILFTAIPFFSFNLFPLPKNLDELVGRFMTEWLSANLIKLIMASVVGLALFFWRHQYRAQKKLYCIEKTAKEQLQQKLDKLTNRKKSDTQFLYDGVQYILQHTQWGRRKTFDEILEDIIRLARGQSIIIRGRLKHHHSEFANDWYSKIPLDFFLNCVYENHGDLATLALVEKPSAGDPVTSLNALTAMIGMNMRIYYLPTISMAEIKRHYDDK